MKGYLKSTQGLFLLAPKVTTVGREGCDLVIQSSSIDQQHALLEYLPEEDCFVLQDLNSVHGTYVNDCQVDSVSVRLCPGDVIRFGKSPIKHELVIDQQQKVSYLPLNSQTAWAQPLSLLQGDTPQSDVGYSRGLPHLKTIVSTTTQTFAHSPTGVGGLPRPPQTLRSRPLSAGSRRQYVERTPPVGTHKMSKGSCGWVTGTAPGILRSSSSSDLFALQEKEQRQMQLEEELRRQEEEIQRMSFYETECHRKDAVVDQLYKEIAQLQQRLRVAETRRVSVNQDSSDFAQKLRFLEREVAAKKEEVNDLRNKINAMQKASDSGNLTYRADDFKEMQRLREELVKADSERNSTIEYIRHLEQQLLVNKENTDLRSGSKELESVMNQLKEKETEVRDLTVKLAKMQTVEDELKEKIEKILLLERHLKEAEVVSDEHKNVVVSLKGDLEEKTKSHEDRLKELQSLQEELERERGKIEQVIEENHAKHMELVDASAKFDDFHNHLKLIIATSDLEEDGDDLVGVVKRILDEHTHYQNEIKNLERKLSEKEELSSGHDTLKDDINDILTTLSSNGCFSKELKLEIAAIRSKSYASEDIDEIKELFLHLLETQLDWEDGIEAALDINSLTSSEAPGKKIIEMLKKMAATEQEVSDLKSRVEESEELHKIDLEVAVDALREDLTKAHEERMEKVRQECVEKVAEEIRAEETVKRDDILAQERTRISGLEAENDRLKSELAEMEGSVQEKSMAVLLTEEALESYKQTETNLRQKILELQMVNAESLEKFEQDLEERVKVQRNEVNEYKEQIRQHALTICAMEERLNIAATKHKEFQTEISALKLDISVLQSRPAQSTHQPTYQPAHHYSPQQPTHQPNPAQATLHPTPPQTMQPAPPLKPRVVMHSPPLDVTLIQQTLAQVQRENTDYLKQLQEQQDCIFALRRDLAGAMARLTDVSGELSESQKQEVEQYRAKIKHQESEITSLQQQMVKLSDIIDKQTAEIKSLNTEANKQKAMFGKFKNKMNEKEAKLREVEAEMFRTRDELTRNIPQVVDDEPTVSSELSLQGAQCRGERHDQVIARQREALAELRAKLRAMEQGDIPLLTQEEALQQVVILRKELEEMRAINSTRKQVDQTFGDLASCMDVTQMSTLREISEAFEMSENLYLSLLRGIASCLQMEHVDGMRSLLHIPRDERMRLADERERTCERLTESVKALRDRVHRKDELLQGYERDLAKLRHVENLTEMTSGQVHNAMTDIRQKTEEMQCLRESLHRTKERLEQEKRLNAAIKHKKTYHMENESVLKNGWPKHTCLQPDHHAEVNAKKKLLNEKKKKHYEKELKAKEAEVAHHRRLLAEQDNRTASSRYRTNPNRLQLRSSKSIDVLLPPNKTKTDS